ncbi:TetR family transcriptional regulator [Mycobacterium aquaticum]|nr:TetR family transcriptional regulator [Mycobacterium aquaticum]
MRTTLAQQVHRRRRILQVTLGIARSGGYGAVQMRTVAERADVALGTLYRYFPSKSTLLLSALESELDRIARSDRISNSPSAERYEQVWHLITRLNAGMAADPQLAEALARAFMVAYAAKGPESDRMRQRLERSVRQLLAPDNPTTREQLVARIIVDAWASNAMAWLGRRVTTADLNNRLRNTLAVLEKRHDI